MDRIEGCIFDLDGVVVDTAKYHYFAWKRLAAELGFDFTETDNERLKGVSRMESLGILLEIGGKSYDHKTMLELAEKKNKWYMEYILKMDSSEVLPGVREFIGMLKENKVRIALGSVSRNASIILKQAELEQYFDVVIDGTKVTKAKPDPEVFLKGAEEMGLPPEKCLVFEDAAAGIEAAINAGMHSVGVGSPSILGKADMVIPGFVDVTIEILNRILLR